MKASSLSRTSVMILVMCGLMFVCGCQKISGKYKASAMGISGLSMTLDFKSSDKVDVTAGGETKETTYSVDGDKITLHDPQGTKQDLVLTRGSDGSLTDPTGAMKFVKE